jgi:hypothetical protein
LVSGKAILNPREEVGPSFHPSLDIEEMKLLDEIGVDPVENKLSRCKERWLRLVIKVKNIGHPKPKIPKLL